jgi:transcriptional regulator with XRE-family HTH domain
MSIEKILQKLNQDSIPDSSWLEKAIWRQENEDWLDVSFTIAVKMLSALSTNKKASVFPSNQKELAEAMACSAQYVNKLLRGQENLQIETICKIQRILNIKLIEVPKMESKQKVQYIENMGLLPEKLTTTSSSIIASNTYATVIVAVQTAGEGNYALAA